ncbi:unnamed protein product [Lactuca virosa]|uniref:Uncharacterized protein n=1 Tax=Lactuca virosa TaxID=75947 RepID=A0AAU9PQW2_9ASTR|nr:unnamed protein product [Lactuca virosa]
MILLLQNLGSAMAVVIDAMIAEAARSEKIAIKTSCFKEEDGRYENIYCAQVAILLDTTRNISSSDTLSGNMWANLSSWMPRREVAPQGGINTDATAVVSVVSDEEIQKLVAIGFDKVIFSRLYFLNLLLYDDSGEGKERRLEDEFEPTILSNKYKTEKGEYIREIDIPERIQISKESTGPPPADEMSIEEGTDQQS